MIINKEFLKEVEYQHLIHKLNFIDYKIDILTDKLKKYYINRFNYNYNKLNNYKLIEKEKDNLIKIRKEITNKILNFKF